MLGRRHVLPSVVSTLTEIMVEGTFPTGTYLVTVHHPISTNDGNLEKALYGSFLPIPDESLFSLPEDGEYEGTKMPGAVVTVKGKVQINKDRKRIKLKVTSKGDRPIQVSVNTLLEILLTRDRLARIITLSRRIRSWSSIDSRPTGTVSISPLVLRCDSNRVIPKP